MYLGQLCLSKGVLWFLIDECYIRSVKRYCFVRKYAAVPGKLEIIILQYTGWCVLILRDIFFQSAQLLLPVSWIILASPSCYYFIIIIIIIIKLDQQ